jgi:hypothetical protein
MAGLFELQLPNGSRRRRSSDISDPRRSTARVRSRSPTPEVAANEIVSQLVAKRQAAAAAPVSSSIFPWRRRATGGPESSRQSHSSSRPSVDSSVRNVSQSPNGKKPSDRLSPQHLPAGDPVSSSSARASSSIDFTLTPSTPGASSVSPVKQGSMPSPSATSTLAQAGLGLGLPAIAFPGPSSPVSRHASAKRKQGRPGTAHGDEGASRSNSSLNVGAIRRVRSFSRHEGSQDVGHRSRTPGQMVNNSGDVLVFSRERAFSATPHVYSNPEHSSRHSTLQKGKERERQSDIDVTPLPESIGVVRGRQATSPSMRIGDREKSSTRRTSWWPGRRRVDSSPSAPHPPVPPPPPIPRRSSERSSLSLGTNTPLLPSFRPFSPLMGDFRMDSPKIMTTYLEDHAQKMPHPSDDVPASVSQSEKVVVRRRHSLTGRTTGRANTNILTVSSQASSRPSSQIHSPSHRYSHSFTTSDQNSLLNTLLPSGSPPHSHSRSRPDVAIRPVPTTRSQTTGMTTRPRSMTVNSPLVSPPSHPNRDTPLLLRQPINRPSPSTGPIDPFLSGRGTNTSTRVNPDIPSEVATHAVDSVDLGPAPSTSSGSTSSLSQSAPTNRLPRQRAANTPLTSRTLTASSTSSSLPPPTSSNRLLRRLSSTFFSSSSTMVSPVDPPATGIITAGNPSNVLNSGARTSPAASSTSSPGPSRENLLVPDVFRTSIDDSKPKLGKPPMRLSDESPDVYLSRLVEAVSKAEVAHVLAARCESRYNRSVNVF